MIKVREIICKSILTKSDLADYTLNCYVGCSHRCLYCYARYMTKFKNYPENWGYFVDVKINAPQALTKQLRSLRNVPKEIFMSTVCDGWQPLEAKYRVSRACLEILLRAGLNVSILTKSKLILRDLDLLAKYPKRVRVGMTLTTANLALQKCLEPYASETSERLLALKKIEKKGVEIWAFLGPLIPGLTASKANLEGLFRALEGLNLSQIYVDRLNLRWGVLEALRRGLGRYNYSSFFNYTQYCRQLKQDAQTAAKETNLTQKITFCF